MKEMIVAAVPKNILIPSTNIKPKQGPIPGPDVQPSANDSDTTVDPTTPTNRAVTKKGVSASNCDSRRSQIQKPVLSLRSL